MGVELPPKTTMQEKDSKRRDSLFILALLAVGILLGGMIFFANALRDFRYIIDGVLVILVLFISAFLFVDRRRYRSRNLSLIQEFTDLNIRFSVLADTVSAVSSTLDLEVLQEKILDVMLGLTHSSIGTVLLPDEDRQSLRVMASRGFKPHAVEGLSIPAGKGTIGKVFATGKLAVRNNLPPDPRAAETYLDGHSPRTQVIMPLKAKGEVQGVTIAASTQNYAYTQDDIDLLYSLCHEMAVAIVNVELYQKSQRTLEWLSETQEYTSGFIEEMLAGVAVINAEGEVIYFNREAAALTGLKPEEVLGLNIDLFERGGEGGRYDVLTAFKPILHGCFKEDMVLTRRETLINKPDGRQATFSYNAFPLHRKKGGNVGSAVVFMDVTALKEMEARLRQQDHLSILGQMSAKIAHEVKNPLFAILGLLDELEKAEMGEEQTRLVELIREEAALCSEWISGMLTFVRAPVQVGPDCMTRQSLGDVLHQLLNDFIGQNAVNGLKVVEDLEANLPPVRASADQFRHIFSNLLENALNAMAENGVLTVRAHAGDNGYCEVRVEDNGSGIPEEALPHIYDPFFTTTDGGTGLGLSIVQKIMLDIGGKIDVVSQKNMGTTVVLKLPIG